MIPTRSRLEKGGPVHRSAPAGGACLSEEGGAGSLRRSEGARPLALRHVGDRFQPRAHVDFQE